MAGGGHIARRAARWGVRQLHRADRVARTLFPRRSVLIEARTPMNLAVLRPVFAPLLDDSRVRVRFTGPAREDLARSYGELGVADRVIARRHATWTRVDLYINADPWEAVPLRRVHRQMHFFHGVAGKYDLDCPVGLPLGFARYDRVAFPNEERRRAYVAAGIVRPERAILVGYPKADPLVTGRAVPTNPPLGLDPGRPTALFAPTFSPASALNHAGEAIVETLLACGCNVIVKLHDRSLDADPRYTGGVDWRARFRRFAGPAFLLAVEADSTPYLLASDLMITDHSSIGFEFCVLNRPLIVFDAPGLVEVARINPQKVALLRSAARVVRDPRELADAVRAALSSPADQSIARRQVTQKVFYRPGTATARAVALVYEMLELPYAEGAGTHTAEGDGAGLALAGHRETDPDGVVTGPRMARSGPSQEPAA